MFRDYINRPIDPIPEEYVNLLKRPSSEPDYSLTCLGIALLKPRIENYNGIDGVFTGHTNLADCVANFMQYKSSNTHPVFCYYRYVDSNGAINALQTDLKNAGYEIKENIQTYIKTKTTHDCIIAYKKNENRTACFINSGDIRVYHLVLSFIPLMFPALFEKAPVEKSEYNILASLSKTNVAVFIESIQTAVKKDIVEFRRTMLSNLLKARHEANVTKALGAVEDQRRYISEIEINYANAIKLLKSLIATYEGMKVVETYDAPEEDLVEYLSSNKNIHNLKISADKMSFTVSTLLNNFNENVWQTFSERGFIYDGAYKTNTLLDAFREKKNRKILLDNIFCESPEFAIKIAGNYSIDLQTCFVQSTKHFSYIDADPLFKSYLPNPHLELFACLGGFKSRIITALKNENYISAIELCCASAGSVNLEETDQTFRPLLGWLMSSREKVLHRQDGVDMTPEEALIYLIDKEKANETN